MPDHTQMQQDVYLAIYTPPLAGEGLGTWENPYDASGTKFDTVMSTKITAGQTVRLLPGIFQTNGNSGDGAYAAWNALSGVRIVGSGMGVSTLKLVSTIPTNATRYAVGLNFGSASVNGFELSDLTIDCNLDGNSATGITTGGIRVRGNHIFLRRVKVVKFGAKGSSTEFRVITAAGDGSENCVIEDCVVDDPATAHAGTAIFFAFEGSTAASHKFCAIRNCAGRGAATFEPPPDITTKCIGIAPGIGIGTILEGNQLANIRYGVYGRSAATRDLVIWNNLFRNVHKGVSWDQQSTATTVGRIIAADNMVELSRIMTLPIGFEFIGNSGANRYSDLVLRKNVVSQIPDSAHSLRTDASGIAVTQCERLTAENNVINDTEENSGVWYNNCGSPTFFNNRSTAGELLRGYDNASGKFKQELQDAVQDVLLPI